MRALEELPGRRLLHHLAEIHHADAVGDEADGAEIVRDEEERNPLLAADVGQKLQYLHLDVHVDGRGRLVADNELRFQGKRSGQGDALQLAAGKLKAVAVGVAPRQADHVEQAVNAGGNLGFAGVTHFAHGVAQDRAHAVARVKRLRGYWNRSWTFLRVSASIEAKERPRKLTLPSVG